MGEFPVDREPPRWRPTFAHQRAVVTGALLLIVAVAAGRPDLVVLAAPLIVVALRAGIGRPRRNPLIEGYAGALTVYEGEEFAWSAVVTDLDAGSRVVAVHPAQQFLDVEPGKGEVRLADGGSAAIGASLKATRWGRRTLGEPSVAVYDRLYAWRWGPASMPGLSLTVLPTPTPVDAKAPAPHPRGLVGMERAARPGEGSEFNKVRPFTAGDRLRRIHWPVSARTGRLHVTATHADEDTHIALLIDAYNDIGESAGIDGTASSMDITVRAAATVAGHFLRRGDRVGLRVLGAWGISLLPARAGQVQLRRILDALCLIEPGTARGAAPLAARQGLGAGTLAVMFSPMVEPSAAQQVAVLLRAGLDVIVVDTLPADEVDTSVDPAALAWRIRMLERRLEMDRLASLGVPVVRWSGPHSLDLVLRDLSLRPTRPRLVAR